MPRQFTFRKRQCQFCRKKIDYIDFRDTNALAKYLTPWSKIKPARDTGNCARHQRMLTDCIKRARFMALMPYVRQ